jgi:single-strand DNA-binding protein
MTTLFGLARIGRDAELRTTAQGEYVASLSLAFTYGRKGADGNRPTQWVDGALWGKQAQAIAQYLIKGQQVVVTMEDVHIETFRKSDGTDSVKLAGRVSKIDFAGSAPARSVRPPAAAQAQRQAPAKAPAASGFDDMDDDIPF